MMNMGDLIRFYLIFGVPTETIVRVLSKRLESPDHQKIKDYVAVIRYLLRKTKILPKLNKTRKWSRHHLIIYGLQRNQTNSQILKRLKRHYPEIDERIHKQRICEYRWFYNQGFYQKDLS